MKSFTISKAMHAPLYKRYDLSTGGFVSVGDRDGTYGREDSETGAEIKCLGTGFGGKVHYSSDLKCGLFYPENVFIWGYNENDNSLPHEEVEAFCGQLRYSSIRRVLLPRGYEKGRMSWDYAVMYSPVERQPNWSSLRAIIEQQFPGAELISDGFYIHVNLP